jgi:hypothetical protein
MAVVVLVMGLRMLVGRELATRTFLIRFAIVLIGGGASLVAQPPPPRQDPRAIEHRIGEIRKRLETSSHANAEQRELASFVERYLGEAVQDLKAGRRFQAQRLADAAEACRRAIEHLQHVTSANQTLPSHPPPPPPGEAEDHLREVYFRLRLCDFFLQQIPAPAPVKLLELARRFYEQAVKGEQEGKEGIADEYSKAADDLTHALESLAQVSTA